jgi:hypothetical protein
MTAGCAAALQREGSFVDEAIYWDLSPQR